MKLIPWSAPFFFGHEKSFINKAIDSTWLSDGYFIKKFEKKINFFLKSNFSLTVNNGTSAIHLAYLALNLKSGDEIIIPGYGYLAAANIALQMNLKPVFVDVCLKTFCVTSKNIEKKITSKTKLIVVLHTYGNVCDLDSIIMLARKKKIKVLEDAAESFGSKYKNKYCGTLGDVGTFSFQSTKTITTGEGGMVVTSMNKQFIERLISFRNHGIKKKRYYHYYPGGNFRLTNIQAALGFAQLKKISEIIKKRRKIYNIYYKLLKDIDGIKLQKFHSNVSPVVWTMSVFLDPKIFINRDKIIKHLLKLGIETRNGFYSADRLPIYKKFIKSNLRNSNLLSKNIICLPFYVGLNRKKIERITKELIKLKK